MSTETTPAASSKEAARARITDLTVQIVHLVNERAALALEVGRAKVAEGATQVRDLDREELVIGLATEVSEGPLSARAVARIVQTVMNEASALQAETYGLELGAPLDQGPGFAVAPAANE